MLARPLRSGSKRPTGYARTRAGSRVPIQTGENWWFGYDMARAIAAGASDLCMPDLMKIGGVTGWLRAMGQAEAASLPVSSHLFIEASAHVLPVTPLAHYLDYLDIAGAVLAAPPLFADGCVTARGPGLGIDGDEAAVERYQFIPADLRLQATGAPRTPRADEAIERASPAAAAPLRNHSRIRHETPFPPCLRGAR